MGNDENEADRAAAGDWLTLTEALPLLDLRRARVMQLKAEGKIHLQKRLSDVGGSQLYIERGEIARFLQQRAKEAAAATGPGRRPKVSKPATGPSDGPSNW